LKGIRLLLTPYVVTVLAVSSALLLTLLLQSLLAPTLFQLFFAAVAVSTWYGGMQPGLLATALSTVAIGYCFVTPEFSFIIAGVDNILRLGMFVLVAIIISSLNSGLRTAKQRLELSMKKLQASEARFRRLAESNIIGVIVADINGPILEANDAFLQMVGYSREDLQGGRVKWRSMTPPEYYEVSKRSLAELKAKGICTPFEKEYIRKDGSRVPILLGSTLLESDSEHVIGFVVDLSERKKAEEALRQREEQLRLITNALPVLISYVDAQQRYRFNNKRYEDWHGLPASEIYGKHIREVLGEPAYESILPYVEAVLSGKQVNYEKQLQFQDGLTRYTSITYVPQFNQEGQVEGFVALISDITERKLAEQESEQLLLREQASRAEAEAANRMKDEFLATLSHELRTPLNAMVGWTQLLRSRKFDEATTAKGLETIDRNVKSLAALIEDVLDVSRIIRGKLRLNMHPVELLPVVQAAIDTVRSASQAKEISIEYFFDSKIGVILGDANRLQQVVWNLLSNAVKFTPPKGKVEVQLQRIDGSLVQIRVSDTGEGISPEFLPYVFERFRQADSSSTRSYGGLGLGLAIVRHLVELHGGTVHAESPGIGLGATFIVSLPMKTVGLETINPQQLSPKIGREIAKNQLLKLDGLRVLVVDDEPDARQLLTTMLGQYEAQVIAVASAKEALIALQEFQPNVLVSDIGMPLEDGYSLIRKVRALSTEQGGKIPAVALTAYARAEDRMQALLAGFQLHVPKPVSPVELAAVIANLSGRT
jgi:PAS domain S-box-containing protein